MLLVGGNSVWRVNICSGLSLRPMHIALLLKFVDVRHSSKFVDVRPFFKTCLYCYDILVLFHY